MQAGSVLVNRSLLVLVYYLSAVRGLKNTVLSVQVLEGEIVGIA